MCCALAVPIVLMVACAALPALPEPPQPPNLILILTDDQGWSMTSQVMDARCAQSASGYLRTPHLDRLAREGLRFTSGYAPASHCTPTRRCILYGTSAARSGTEFDTAWSAQGHLTLPRALQRADPRYRCAHFGKWGERMPAPPAECGYDESDGATGNRDGSPPGRRIGGPGSEPYYLDENDPKQTGGVTERTIAFLREQARAGRPFFVQASYYAPHLAVVCREGTLARYQDRGAPDRQYTPAFAAMLEEMDEGIGRILAALDELDLARSTYVFFTSDNGGRNDVPGAAPDGDPPNHPLTGAKHTLSEGGLRVPFVVRGPGVAAGAFEHAPVCGYDLLPTLYDLAGGGEPLPAEVDGVSLRPLLEGRPLARPGAALYFHRPARLESAIREGDHKLRLVWWRNGTVRRHELYDVGSEPREEGREIGADHPELAARLQEKLIAYLESVHAETHREIQERKQRQDDRETGEVGDEDDPGAEDGSAPRR